MLTRRSVGAATAGALLALALTALRLPWTQVPYVHVAAARALLGAMLGALITVAAVLFWIRGTFVQMAAAHFSPRVVQGHLSDRHEQRALPFLVGAFAYCAVLLLALRGDGAAPPVATVAAVLVSVGAFLTVVRTIEVGLRMSEPSALVLALARHAVDVVHARLSPHAAAADERRPDIPAAATPVIAESAGWLSDVDEPGLLGALPRGATVELDAAHGRLVTPGQRVARVAGDADPAVAHAAVRRALTLSDQRPADDIDVALRELVDVTLQAMAPGAGDVLHAYEAIEALEWVLAELLAHDPPPPRLERDGRVLLRAAEPSHEQRVRAVLVPLAEVVTRWRMPTDALDRSLSDAAARLERQGLEQRAELLRATWREVRGSRP